MPTNDKTVYIQNFNLRSKIRTVDFTRF